MSPRASISLVIVIIYSAKVLAAESGPSLQKQTMHLLEQIHTQLSKANGANNTNCEFEPNKTCDLNLICDQVRSNRNAKELYKNNQGEVIPNFQLIGLQQGVEQCRNYLAAATVDPIKKQKEMNKSYLKKRKEFLKSIEAHHEEVAMVQVEKALMQAGIEQADREDAGALIPSRKEVRDNIKKAEAKAGVTLSAESRSKWVGLSFQSDTEAPETVAIAGVENPFFNPALLVDVKSAGGPAQLEKNRAAVQKETNRAFEIFQDTKKEILSLLTQRKNGKNDREIDNLKNRIEKIKMRPIGFDPLSPGSGSCATPNAFYDAAKHTFELCPQLLQLPSASLQSIIAHELGHSIDPCFATYPLQRVEGSAKANPNVAALKAQEELYKKMGYTKFQTALPSQGPIDYTSFDSEVMSNTLEKERDQWALKSEQSSVGLNSNPFSSVISCLQGKDSVGARIGSVDSALKNVRAKIAEMKKQGVVDSDPSLIEMRETESRIATVYEDKKACSFIESEGGHSQIQEAFADWVGTEVISRKIKSAKNSQQAQQIAFESNALTAALSCAGFESDIKGAAQKTLEQAGCLNRGSSFDKDLANMNSKDDPHPEGFDRASRISMAHPAVVRAMSCQKEQGVKHCE